MISCKEKPIFKKRRFKDTAEHDNIPLSESSKELILINESYLSFNSNAYKIQCKPMLYDTGKFIKQ